MKTTIFCVLILLSCVRTSLAGQSLQAEGVVRAAITAAQHDSLDLFAHYCDTAEIAAHPKHPMSADSVVALFKEIKEAEVQLETSGPSDGLDRITVKMTAPRRINFDLVGTKQINGIFWRIVAIHQ